MKVTDEQIINVLWQTDGNVTAAARILKTSRQNMDTRVLRLRIRGVDLPPTKRGAPKRNKPDESKK